MKILEFLKEYRTWQQLDRVIYQTLTEQDRDNIALLSVMPQYKSLEKLLDNISVDLQNRGLREAQKEAEFLGIKWTTGFINLFKKQVKNQYEYMVRKQDKETNKAHK